MLQLNWPLLIPLIFVGIGQLITTTFTAYGTYRNGKKADEIHVLVNSNMTQVKSDLVAANLRIEALEAMITKLVHEAHVPELPAP
jgi:hypothetical protein